MEKVRKRKKKMMREMKMMRMKMKKRMESAMSLDKEKLLCVTRRLLKVGFIVH